MNPRWCVHYTGAMDDACAAGVRYADVRGEGPGVILPCVSAPGAPECAARRLPTAEEIRVEQERDDARIAAMVKAMEIVAAAAEASPDRTAQGTGDCPACGKTFKYTASLPKRRRAFMFIRCETPNCLALIT